MKYRFKITSVFVFLFKICLFSQCPSGVYSSTISGLHTADINPVAGTTVYIASTATVTGNINLISANIINCGTITNDKIFIYGKTGYNHTLENFGTITSDSIIVDSDAVLRNNNVLNNKYLRTARLGFVYNHLGYHKSFSTEIYSEYRNFGNFSSQNVTVFKNGLFSNALGCVRVVNQLLIDSTGSFYNLDRVQADTLFRNYGFFGNPNVNFDIKGYLKVLLQSENYGKFERSYFCDETPTASNFDVQLGYVSSLSFSCFSDCSNDVGINHFKNHKNELKLHPNPASNILHITTEQNQNTFSEIEITNSLGQTLMKQVYNPEVDVFQLPPGCYVLKIISKNKQVYHAKFLKE